MFAIYQWIHLKPKLFLNKPKLTNHELLTDHLQTLASVLCWRKFEHIWVFALIYFLCTPKILLKVNGMPILWSMQNGCKCKTAFKNINSFITQFPFLNSIKNTVIHFVSTVVLYFYSSLIPLAHFVTGWCNLW